MMGYIIYGLTNCNTTKAAINWFKKNHVSYKLNNYKTDPPTKEKLENWCNQLGWEKLLNKRGTAFQRLHPAIQQGATTQRNAIEIMELRPSTIKRPIIEKDNKIITIGFNEILYNVHCL
ncbi:MAG: Spx/MgsR family RNA polymerase-binding regulatory protein [Chitinophagaceae bacterium]|nr:Spx/MgsR family RNA polymerase-binding regulatory protein [Chitinophagaceae bacterium]MCW5905185.1 Spx/MgsR family RNA polymerase-binding regulatory protein [Chitinophagaceae bacterium]